MRAAARMLARREAMSCILIGWELGLHLGHLGRLLPISSRLQARGHALSAVVCDLSAADKMLGRQITLLQAPQAKTAPPSRPLASFADVLLTQGWRNPSTLAALVRGWLGLIKLYRPDLLLLDYSPTALLAARIARCPVALIGNGFEIPPAEVPWPPFPGFPWVDRESAIVAERTALTNANTVLKQYGTPPLDAMKDLLATEIVALATLPELHHYGPGQDVAYLGPLRVEMQLPKVAWPRSTVAQTGPRIFACLRPDTRGVTAILGGLAKVADRGAHVICVALGFDAARLEAFRRPTLDICTAPVALAPLIDTADLCVTYGAEGTVAAFLLGGVPQLLIPGHVEAEMAARRIEALGAGVVMREAYLPESFAELVEGLAHETRYRDAAQAFAQRHQDFNSDKRLDAFIGRIESVIAPHTSHANDRQQDAAAVLH